MNLLKTSFLLLLLSTYWQAEAIDNIVEIKTNVVDMDISEPVNNGIYMINVFSNEDSTTELSLNHRIHNIDRALANVARVSYDDDIQLCVELRKDELKTLFEEGFNPTSSLVFPTSCVLQNTLNLFDKMLITDLKLSKLSAGSYKLKTYTQLLKNGETTLISNTATSMFKIVKLSDTIPHIRLIEFANDEKQDGRKISFESVDIPGKYSFSLNFQYEFPSYSIETKILTLLDVCFRMKNKDRYK
jgi:hypothetical protein